MVLLGSICAESNLFPFVTWQLFSSFVQVDCLHCKNRLICAAWNKTYVAVWEIIDIDHPTRSSAKIIFQRELKEISSVCFTLTCEKLEIWQRVVRCQIILLNLDVRFYPSWFVDNYLCNCIIF